MRAGAEVLRQVTRNCKMQLCAFQSAVHNTERFIPRVRGTVPPPTLLPTDPHG